MHYPLEVMLVCVCGILVQSPISIGLWIAAAAMVLLPPLLRRFGKSRSARPAA